MTETVTKREFSDEHRTNMSEAHRGKKLSAEHRVNISEGMKKYMQDLEARKNLSEQMTGTKNPNFGKKISAEHRAKLSESNNGWRNPNWKGGTSFEPYCEKFNEHLKEQVRERYGLACFICGKPESLNGQRLCVHHVDSDKMQGCNGKKWLLVPLCRSCHSRTSLVGLIIQFTSL